MQRLSKQELAALVTMLGISSGALANATPITSDEKPFLIAENEGAKKSSEMACGKGACGVAKPSEKKKSDSSKKEEKKTETKKKDASSGK